MHFNSQQLTELHHKISILLTLLLLIGFYKGNSQDEYFPYRINASYDNNSNINHPQGTFSHDLKRSVGLFLNEIGDDFLICSYTLINTVKQNGKPYILRVC